MNRRDKIVETAFLLFLKKGFNGISLNEIQKAAQITTGGFYYYFDSKESLIIEVIDKYIFYYFKSPTEEIKKMRIPTKEKIKRYFAKSIGYNIKKHKFTNITSGHQKFDYKELYLLYFGGLQTYTLLKEKYKDSIIYITNVVKELIDDSISSGELGKDIDSMEFAEVILSIFSGTISSWLVMDDMDLYDSFSNHLDLVWEQFTN